MPPNQSPPTCRRCGTCCRKGGPGLHAEDRPLVARGILPRVRLVTLRAGEPVFDNVAGRLETLSEEMVKIRDLDSGGCPYLGPDAACLIHDQRPMECRLLFCEAPEELMARYADMRLTRRDCVNPAGGLFELIRHHEERCPAAKAAVLAREAAKGDLDARAAVEELARFDAAYRELLIERAGLDPLELPFYLGRPLSEILRPILRRGRVFSSGTPA